MPLDQHRDGGPKKPSAQPPKVTGQAQRFSLWLIERLDGVRANFTGTDTAHAADLGYPDLAITDLAGLC